MKLSFIYLIFISISAFADITPKTPLDFAFLDIEKKCGKLTWSNEKYLVTTYNQNYTGNILIHELGTKNKFEKSFDQVPIISTQILNDKIYILKPNTLEIRDFKFNLISRHKTQNIKNSIERSEITTGMVKAGDKLIISHGTLGYSIFNLKTKVLERTLGVNEFQKPKVSSVTDVTSDGENVFLLLDNFSFSGSSQKKPFRGVMLSSVFSPEKIKKRVNLYDAGATGVQIEGDSLFVNFNGFANIVKYSTKSILNAGKKIVKAKARIWVYPNHNYGSQKGKPLIYDQKIYSCWRQMENSAELGIKPRVFGLDEF